MPIHAACPHCKAKLRLREKAAGRDVSPRCSLGFTVAGQASEGIGVNCPMCGDEYAVDGGLAGKTVRCRTCSELIAAHKSTGKPSKKPPSRLLDEPPSISTPQPFDPEDLAADVLLGYRPQKDAPEPAAEAENTVSESRDSEEAVSRPEPQRESVPAGRDRRVLVMWCLIGVGLLLTGAGVFTATRRSDERRLLPTPVVKQPDLSAQVALIEEAKRAKGEAEKERQRLASERQELAKEKADRENRRQEEEERNKEQFRKQEEDRRREQVRRSREQAEAEHAAETRQQQERIERSKRAERAVLEYGLSVGDDFDKSSKVLRGTIYIRSIYDLHDSGGLTRAAMFKINERTFAWERKEAVYLIRIGGDFIPSYSKTGATWKAAWNAMLDLDK
jgi:hypothetical protein